MGSVETALDNISEAIARINKVIGELPDLLLLDGRDDSTLSMINFLKKRVNELEVLRRDIEINHDVFEEKRSYLGL